jgi:1,4-dihydroxy-2-naphthoate octaprenyltransferase
VAALVVALALQVGVNYANDYSDGVRGTDQDRRGPLRLVGAGLATPTTVRAAALVSFAVAGTAGLWLASVTSWWLVLVGVAAIAAGWYYTGGARPYGYRGLGELSVFVFFGLVATAGTTYVQVEQVSATGLVAGAGCGALACAILVANNVRDLESDRGVGKRTLAVMLGDRRTRGLYALLVASAYVVVVALSVVHRGALLALASAPLAIRPLRLMARAADATDLVAALKETAVLLLAYGLLLSLGLALG